MDYRYFYEKETCKELPKDFDVHHIDENRDNNNIDNLVAIPKWLHQKYHLCKNNTQSLELSNIDLNINPASYMFHIESIIKYAECVEEIHKYLCYKKYLLKHLPYNLYGYNYETK